MIRGVKRVCLGCGVLTDVGSRCAPCQATIDRAIEARRGPRPHYGGSYARRAKAVRESATSCYWCHESFTLANPVQADHLVPRDPSSPLVPSCRRCNVNRSKSSTAN